MAYLRSASDAVGALRAQSSYNWVDLTSLFGNLVRTLNDETGL